MVNTEERDGYLCEDYRDGKEIHELARTYGISDRRVSQILQENAIPRRPRSGNEKPPLSEEHARLGLKMFHRRFEKGLTCEEAAEVIGWGIIKLRKVEKGVTEVELLDLIDIAAYLEVSIGTLMEKPNGKQ